MRRVYSDEIIMLSCEIDGFTSNKGKILHAALKMLEN